MSKSPEEKERGFIGAIQKCKSLESLLKMKTEGASAAILDAFNVRKTELEEKATSKNKLIPVTKDGETIHVCAAQVEQHRRLGWTPKE
jgi:hypothetical protein